jgi:hypothetical protein
MQSRATAGPTAPRGLSRRRQLTDQLAPFAQFVVQPELAQVVLVDRRIAGQRYGHVHRADHAEARVAGVGRVVMVSHRFDDRFRQAPQRQQRGAGFRVRGAKERRRRRTVPRLPGACRMR